MEQEQSVSSATSREKLGLSLAGGGFRASLFHLGVLRRMAELDLLRRVEVLSTVSGGSIIGALYILLLKKHLEAAPDGNLSRDGYVEIVDELEDLLVAGIRRNLRTRLFMNPLGVLRVLLTSQSMGRRMARLYERHLYARVVEGLTSSSALDRAMRPGRLPLEELRIQPGGDPMAQGIGEYNRRAIEEGRSVSTRLVLNATTLNSGARFWFSSSEVGDWQLGQVRHGEIDHLRSRKRLLEMSGGALRAMLGPAEPRSGRGKRSPLVGEGAATGDRPASDLPRRTVALAAWWRSGEHEDSPPDPHWAPLFEVDDFPGKLVTADLGLLRQAKLPAWYLFEGWTRDPPVTGGRSGNEHWHLLWDALGRIDADAEASLTSRLGDEPALTDRLLEFVLELYWLRSAKVVSSRIERFWRRTTVGDAVGASANFPPVFPPFQLLGLYDDLHVSRLGLTDGGVYDNMGLAALLEEGCTQLVASDTSGLFTERERVSTGRLHMMTRIVSILTKVVASGQREALRERRRVSREIEPHVGRDDDLERFLEPRKLTGLAYFHIESSPVDLSERRDGDPPPPEAPDRERRRALASLRTDLDAFGELEIAGLVNHGYGTADRYLRRYFSAEETRVPLRNPFWQEPPELPREVRVQDSVFERVLAAGGSRFFRSLRVFAPLSWAFTLAAAVGLVGWTWDVRVSVEGALEGLGAAVAGALTAMAPWLGAAWTEWTFPVGSVVLGAMLLLVVLPRVTGFSPVEALRDRGAKGWARRLAALGKWGRALAGNLLWLLGLLPVMLALGASLVAWISDLFFGRPYLRAARNRPSALRDWIMDHT